MKFKIEKTSLMFKRDEKPTERAFKEALSNFNNNNVLFEEDEWYIEVNSLEELIALVREEGYPIIIGLNKLEIYDDYRE